MQIHKTRLKTREVVVITLVLGAVIIAILDGDYRAIYFNLTEAGLVAYFAQLLPQSSKKESSQEEKT